LGGIKNSTNSIQLDPNLSITAVDLPAKSSPTVCAYELAHLFQGLKNEGIISGQPLVIISPSASGKNIVGLLELSESETEENKAIAPKILGGWIPVGCNSVMQTSDEVLSQINEYSIPTLAIYGDLDTAGRVSSEKLKEVGGVNVDVVEMNGGHPVYLDDTDKFINFVIMFMKKVTHEEIEK